MRMQAGPPRYGLLLSSDSNGTLFVPTTFSIFCGMIALLSPAWVMSSRRSGRRRSCGHPRAGARLRPVGQLEAAQPHGLVGAVGGRHADVVEKLVAPERRLVENLRGRAGVRA